MSKWLEIKDHMVVTQSFADQQPGPAWVWSDSDSPWPGYGVASDGSYVSPPNVPDGYLLTGFDPLTNGWIFKKVEVN